jgi:uncharacterized protein YdaU (DUF1376 family)
MIWFKKYPADFGQDTQDLDLTEIGAYNKLLDFYYATERPLPPEMFALYRIANAQKRAERKAVEKVADKFFPPNGDGYRHNKRADEEIAKARALSAKRAEAGSRGGSK